MALEGRDEMSAAAAYFCMALTATSYKRVNALSFFTVVGIVPLKLLREMSLHAAARQTPGKDAARNDYPQRINVLEDEFKKWGMNGQTVTSIH